MRWLLAIVLLAGCGDDGGNGECTGVGDAGVSGATISVDNQTFGYGNFDWGKHNDCGVEQRHHPGPAGHAPSDFGIGLCLPNPDAIGSAPVSLADRSLVELQGASAQSSTCIYQFLATATPTGTVTFGGFCTTSGASFTVTFAGSVAAMRTCTGGAPEATALNLGGTALVTERP
jgi:hypothetical protein